MRRLPETAFEKLLCTTASMVLRTTVNINYDGSNVTEIFADCHDDIRLNYKSVDIDNLFFDVLNTTWDMVVTARHINDTLAAVHEEAIRLLKVIASDKAAFEVKKMTTPHRYLYDRLPREEYKSFMTRFNLAHDEATRPYALENGMVGMVFSNICGDVVTTGELMNWLLTPVDEADIVDSH